MADWAALAETMVTMLKTESVIAAGSLQYPAKDIDDNNLPYGVMRNPMTDQIIIGTSRAYQIAITFDMDFLILRIPPETAHLTAEQERLCWLIIPTLFDAIRDNPKLASGSTDYISHLALDSPASIARFTPATDSSRGHFAGVTIQAIARFRS